MDEWREAPLTRAGLATILARSLGWGEQAQSVESNVPFSDMTNHWASGYVLALAREGIVIGYPDGLFLPDDPVTLDQVNLMLARTLRAGSEATLANARATLQAVGVDTITPCYESNFASHGQALMLLDRAMRVTLYSRFEQ